MVLIVAGAMSESAAAPAVVRLSMRSIALRVFDSGLSMRPDASQLSAPKIRSTTSPVTALRLLPTAWCRRSSAVSIRGNVRSTPRSTPSVDAPSMTCVIGSPDASNLAGAAPSSGPLKITST